MQYEESMNPADWFRIGDKEIIRARNLYDLDDMEGAGFNIQQAVEKYLKGFLLSKGWKLKRTHDLGLLLNYTLDYEPSFEEYRAECLKMTEYYIEERYPYTAFSEFTREEILASLEKAEALIGKIKDLIK